VYDLEAIPDVAIINRGAFPLSRQIDNEAGELVLQRIESLGVKVYTNCGIKDIITTTRSVPNAAASGNTEAFAGLEFDDGTILSAQLVIFAIGISPRDELARESGIDVHKKGGIVVDDYLATSAKDVYAVGECASWRGNTYGLIGPGGNLQWSKIPLALRPFFSLHIRTCSGNGGHPSVQFNPNRDTSRNILSAKDERPRPLDKT
jgi:nitrite reductase (NAD(P)H)